MVDFSLFLEWHFLLMSVGTILLFTWFIVPYFYLAELMVRNDYTEQEASTLLSIIGFTNFLGMVRSSNQQLEHLYYRHPSRPCLLSCDPVYCCGSMPTFQRTIPPPSWSSEMPVMDSHESRMNNKKGDCFKTHSITAFITTNSS
jgi:hypothetical protein